MLEVLQKVYYWPVLKRRHIIGTSTENKFALNFILVENLPEIAFIINFG